ncbi:MAG TPA: Slp family lipoprotein, partial [Nitrospira sp.]|nr:Slp family lipoprotein [Nitrospira sp.]
ADLMAKVDETVSFTELRSTPSSYVGRVVMLSGVAINARLVKGGTEIEILQLPTDTGLTPSRSEDEIGRTLSGCSLEGFLAPPSLKATHR